MDFGEGSKAEVLSLRPSPEAVSKYTSSQEKALTQLWLFVFFFFFLHVVEGGMDHEIAVVSVWCDKLHAL